jgi:hypothetical protein
MRSTSPSLPVLSFVVAALSVACGGPGGSAPAATAAAPASSAESPSTVTSSDAPAADAPKADKKAGLTEEKLQAAKSLESFPEIDAVTKEIGAPFDSGKSARLQWYFDKSGSGKSLHCSTIDVMKGPGGKAVFYDSVYTGPECGTVKATKSGVIEVLTQLGSTESDLHFALPGVMAKGKSFDEASAAFEKKLGKPQLKGEPAYAAWKYTKGEGECSVLLVTSHLGSNAGQAIWDIPCH